jgi:hypothetical protein
MMDKEMLCIDCILYEGHKNHEINSVIKAVEIERSLLESTLEKVEKSQAETQIEISLKNMNEHIIETRKRASQNIYDLANLYGELHSLLEEKEKEQVEKVQRNLEKEEILNKDF